MIIKTIKLEGKRLKDCLTKQEISNTSCLIVEGILNEMDIIIIREMLNNGNLTDVNLGACIGLDRIRREAFYDCTALKGIVIPNSIKIIEDYAFAGCPNLTHFTIPESVTEIHEYVFARCIGLKYIFIPRHVFALGYNPKLFGENREFTNPFCGCYSLTSIVVDNNNNRYFSHNGALFSKHIHVALVCYPNISEFALPDSVETIYEQALLSCNKLKNIIIPNTVEKIEAKVFKNCTHLETIVLSKSISCLRDELFAGCKSLSEVIIPDSVKVIERWVFRGCSNLKHVFISKHVEKIGQDNKWLEDYCYSNILSGCTNLHNLEIAKDNPYFSSKNGILYNNNMTYLIGCADINQHIEIPNTVIGIREYAFSGCSNMKSISIPDSVTEIKDDTFYGCEGLANITIPDSVKKIGKNAFEDCNLKEVILPHTCEIEKNSFDPSVKIIRK